MKTRPQMTRTARDIMKSWQGSTNSEKVTLMNNKVEFLSDKLKRQQDFNDKLSKEFGDYKNSVSIMCHAQKSRLELIKSMLVKQRKKYIIAMCFSVTTALLLGFALGYIL